mmetsp:Transcript_17386/g.35650  ORF Transcript_17386/g.35650 Transcript_17386/m.35650 type:complete len:143 (-) Transcript_17386:667-1095(-)
MPLLGGSLPQHICSICIECEVTLFNCQKVSNLFSSVNLPLLFSWLTAFFCPPAFYVSLGFSNYFNQTICHPGLRETKMVSLSLTLAFDPISLVAAVEEEHFACADSLYLSRASSCPPLKCRKCATLNKNFQDSRRFSGARVP